MPTHLLLFPYLPLGARTKVNGWTLIPSGDLTLQDCAGDLALKCAQGLITLYPFGRGQAPLGAFVQPPAQAVGDAFALNEMARLRRSVLITLLDTNPSGLLPEEDRTGSEAWSTYTSDHAQIWGHRIDDDGWVADQRGGMVTVLAGGYNALQPDDFRFAPPREMHEPRLVRSWDEEYAAAIHCLLGRRGELSRRLAQAIDWLELAWQNGDSLDENLRIAALYSGFEVLLARPADAKAAALALSALLDRPGTRKRQYTSWRTKRGNPVPDKISQLAWWFVQFAWLRNAILHGARLTSRHYHDRRGRSHKWMAELKLREAIKETVASAGYSDLRLTPRERALRRAYSKLIAAAN